MATTIYNVQQRATNSGDWFATDYFRGKKGTAVAHAESIHAQDKFAVRVVTGAGTVVFELKSRKRIITKHTPAFTLTIDVQDVTVPSSLEGYVFCYDRPRRGWSVLRNMEAPVEERYAVIDEYGRLLDFFDTTRAAGRAMTDQVPQPA